MVVLCLRELSFLSASHFMPQTHPLPYPAILSNWASPPSSMSHMSWYIYNSNVEILLEHDLCCVVIFNAVTCTSCADLIKCKYIACKFASGINVITSRRLHHNLSTYLSYKLDSIVNLSIKCSWVIYINTLYEVVWHGTCFCTHLLCKIQDSRVFLVISDAIYRSTQAQMKCFSAATIVQ